MKVSNSKRTWKSALGLFILLLTVISSCKKKDVTVLSNDSLTQAKEWFAAQKIKLYVPNWEQAKFINLKNQQFLSVPTAIFYSGKEKITSTLLINISAENKEGYITEFINSDLPANEAKLARIYGAMVQRNAIDLAEVFEGNALLFTLNHDFIEGWHTIKGKLVGRISENPKTLKDRLKMTIDHDASDCYQYYWVERDAYTGELVNSTYLYTVCESTGGGGNSGNGGSGGGTGSNGNSNSNREIIDSVKNTCLKTQLINALNARTTIKNMLNETFGGSIQFESLNLKFKDVTNLPDTTSGDASRESATSLFFNIRLNANTLPNYSQEYILSTIYHEILHAYMFSKLSKGADGKYHISTQHEDMANQYVILMTGALKIAFPNISEQEAFGLSWGGLAETDLYTKKLSQIQRDAITEINRKYTNKSATGKKGTYCN